MARYIRVLYTINITAFSGVFISYTFENELAYKIFATVFMFSAIPLLAKIIFTKMKMEKDISRKESKPNDTEKLK